MSNILINCPECGTSIELTSALAAPLLEAERVKIRAEANRELTSERAAIIAQARRDAETALTDRLRASEAAIAERDAKLDAAKKAELAARRAAAEAEQAKRDIELTVRQRVDAEKAEIERQAAERAHGEAAARLKAAEEALVEKDAKLKAAQDVELEARRMTAEAEEAKHDIELTVRRRVDAEKAEIERQVSERERAATAARLKVVENALAEKDAKLKAAQDAELEARRMKAEAEEAKHDIELTVRQRVDAEKVEIEQRAAERGRAEATTRLKALEDALAEKDTKLKAAQDAELEARRMRNEVEEAKREIELTVTRRVDEERNKVREQTLKERDETYRLQLADKEGQMQAMRETIEELRRKGNSGSQQLAGDVLEVDLVQVLQQTFPGDTFERVPKGLRGGDVVHTVRNAGGQACGRILWESKRTKNWSDTWLPKLREDQRNAKCELAALVTECLPEDVTHFEQLERVWVTGLPTVVPMAAALRHALIETATTRRALAGADSKKDLVYAYLTGSEFRGRVRSLVEAMTELRADLDRERRLMNKQWASREKQIVRVELSMVGMYGDLEGILGASLPSVDGLVLPEIEGPTEMPVVPAVNLDSADHAQEA